jgi:hypothetical protein
MIPHRSKMIGGDPTITDLRSKALQSTGDAGLFPARPNAPTTFSFATAAMLLFKAACAEDAYCMITTFDSGLIVSLIAMILMLLLTQASHHIYVRTWSFGRAYTYQEVWELSFGRHVMWFPALCLAAAYFVCMVTGFWESDAFVQNLIISQWPNSPAIFQNSWFWQYLFLILLTLPSFLTTRISSFAPMAWIGFFSTVTAIICLGIYAFQVHFVDPTPVSAEIPIAEWDFLLVYGSLSAFNIAFFAHPVIPDVASELHHATRFRVLSAIWVANILCGICVYLIPAFGYLTMAEVEDGESVFHYLNPNAPEVIVGKLAVISNSICSNCLYQYFLAKTVASEIHSSAVDHRIVLGVTGLVFGALSIWVNFWEDLGIAIFYGVACVSFSILAFILPPLYFLAQYRFQSVQWALVSLIVLLVGGGMMLTSLTLAIQNIVSLA